MLYQNEFEAESGIFEDFEPRLKHTSDEPENALCFPQKSRSCGFERLSTAPFGGSGQEVSPSTVQSSFELQKLDKD
jgi:hypothetical protein